jgi:tetratricopeptide (TPR) repeat protein
MNDISLSPADLVQALRVDHAATTITTNTQHEDEQRSREASVPRWPLVALAAAAGVAASLILVPRGVGSERGDAPRATLEAAIASGNQSPGTMIALARERQRAGDAPGGVALLQQLVEQQPTHAPGWQALADMLQDMGRTSESVAALEQAQRLAPTPERERLMLTRRQSLKDAGIAPTVGTRVGTAQENLNPIQRAEAFLAAGAPGDALNTLDAFASAQPESVDTTVLAMQMKALLTLRPEQLPASKSKTPGTEAAVARAKVWLKAHPQSAAVDVVRLSTPLSQAGQHAAAAALLEPWLDQGGPTVGAVWIQAMRLAGQGDTAMAKLARLGGANAAHDVLRQRVMLAIDSGKPEAAMEAARSHGLERTPGPLLANLAQALVQDPSRLQARAPMLRELWAKGGSALSRHDPLLAARVAWAAGDYAGAGRMADAALPTCEGRPDCAVQLAAVNHQLGRGIETQAALKQADGDIDESLLGEYARLSVLHGVAAEALARIDRQRRPVTSPAYGAAWALVATAAGRQPEVLRWLESSRPADVPEALLRDLFQSAARLKAHQLTVVTGIRLDARALKPADRVFLAQALMDTGRTREALDQWRRVRSSSRNYDDAFANDLRKALSRGVGVEARDAFAQERLTTLKSMPAGPRRDAMAAQLVELGIAASSMAVSRDRP